MLWDFPGAQEVWGAGPVLDRRSRWGLLLEVFLLGGPRGVSALLPLLTAEVLGATERIPQQKMGGALAAVLSG